MTIKTGATICRMSNFEYWTIFRRDDGSAEVFGRHSSYLEAIDTRFISDDEFYNNLVVPKEAELLAAPACPADPTIRVFFMDREPIASDLAVKRWGVEIAADLYTSEARPIGSGLSFGDAYRLASKRMRLELGDVKLSLPVHLLVSWLERGLRARRNRSRSKRDR